MRTLDGNYLNAAKSAGRYPNVKIDLGDNVILTGSDAIIDVEILKGDSSKPASFDTARAISAICKVSLDRRKLTTATEALLISGAEFKVYAAFDNATGTELGSAKLGTFYVMSYDNSDKAVGKLAATDFMLYTQVDFNPEVDQSTGVTDYPCKISALAKAALYQSGMSLNNFPLDVDPHIAIPPYKSEEPVAQNMKGNPYTCREVLARIAAMNLGAMFIDADGTPKMYGYGAVNTTAITDGMIIDIKGGTETYYINQIVIFKSEERMAKKRTNYRALPYAPRFEEMDDIGEGSDWRQEIIAKVPSIRNKPWSTATVTIKGVGEMELGDFVEAAGITLLITGIKYDFKNGCFNETLYSYAFTEEEYLLAPQKTVTTSTGAAKSNTHREFYQPTDPTLDTGKFVSVGDIWYKTDSVANKNLATKYKRSKTGWTVKYNSSTSGGHETYTAVTAPLQFNNGDIWYQIDNTTSKNATAMYKAVNSAWELQCSFGGGSGTVVNVSHAILVDRGGS